VRGTAFDNFPVTHAFEEIRDCTVSSSGRPECTRASTGWRRRKDPGAGMPDYAKLTKAQLIRQLRTLQSQLKSDRGASSTHLAHDQQVHQIEHELQNRELRKAQVQLEATRDRYADLYDFAPVGYISLDEHGRILEINLTAAAMLGQERARLEGELFGNWLAGNDSLAFRKHLDDALHAHGKALLETRLRGRDGQVIDVHLESVAAVKPNGKGIVCRTALLDISERKRVETAFHEERHFLSAILGTINALVVVLDQDGRIVRFNRACERTTGYTFAEAQNRKIWELLVPAEQVAEVKATFTDLLYSVPTSVHQNFWRTRAGGRRLISWSNTVLHDNAGVIRYVIGTGIDITEQQHTEQQLRQHETELAHLARIVSLNELASGLVHEIGQPLTAIGNYTQECLRRLQAGNADSVVLQSALEQVHAQTQRAAGIIQHLRNFAAKRPPERGLADINQLVRRAANLIDFTTRAARVAIRFDLADDLPQVSVDSLQIEQVVLNLLRNAVEAINGSDSDMHEISIQTETMHDNQIQVTVSDCGPGLPAAERKRLFEPFFSTKSSGMGMGLAICRSIVEAHGGTMSAASRQPHGMTFRFILPVSSLSHA
jgi:PAS domain S-box-containing protein